MTRATPAFKSPISTADFDSDFTSVREIRDLANLSRTWSSSRVLNLAKIYINFRDNEDYKARPLFESSALNRCLILKHTLRLDERHLFPSGRQTVTKIILPYDPYDLHLGGRSFFFKQTGFDALMRSYLSIGDLSKNTDVQTLRLIDQLPSLDPFLLRENLLRAGVVPSGVYFQISPTDLKSMADFTALEIENLVSAAVGNANSKGAKRLGGKILSDQLDKALLPLKQTLQMTDEEFNEGIMCWRGFLYYKWCHAELQDGIRGVLAGLSTYRPPGGFDDNTKTFMRKARPRLAKAIVMAIHDATKTLQAYDEVYRAMAVRRDPEPFRQFLLHGSKLFVELGEKIGVLNHIVSFWRFRMSKALNITGKPLSGVEFADILVDFEAGLAHAHKTPFDRR